MSLKLSILVVTYNQENYIRQCLDSIVEQHKDFDYEVIVSDDCSTDATARICDEYGAKYPQFKIFHHPINIGLHKNWEFVMNRCEGEYVAILEGDDYWIQPDKLQKQIAFLDSHKDFSAVFTRAKLHYMDKNAQVEDERLLPILEEREYTEREMCSDFYVLSSSLMFRNCLRPIHYSKQLLYPDIYTFILLSHAGRMYCIGEQTTAYRLHQKNLSRKGDGAFWEATYKQCKYFIKNFPEVADIYQKRLDSCWSHIIYDKTIPAWKYRLLYIWHNPKLLFSRFALKTIKSYILQRILKATGYYTLKSILRQKRTKEQWKIEDAVRRDALKKEILAITHRMLPSISKHGNLTVSLTSHGKRVRDFAPYAICGILKQTKLPNRIVLNLDKAKWNDDLLPDLIKILQTAGVEVNYCEDLGPHTKLLPTLAGYPDDVIVTIDDDIIYGKNMIELLWREYELSDKRTIICHEARSIQRDAKGRLLLYSQWKEHEDTQASCAAVGTLSPYGYRGVLYPPHVFSKEVFNIDVYHKLCPKADDIWFTVMELLDSIPVMSIEHMNSAYNDIDRVNEFLASGSDALHFQNSEQKQNDVQLAALMEYYHL